VKEYKANEFDPFDKYHKPVCDRLPGGEYCVFISTYERSSFMGYEPVEKSPYGYKTERGAWRAYQIWKLKQIRTDWIRY
jgi:hypothetical protein